MQRAFDILISLSSLLLLSPILFVIAIILRITGEGEIFYIQERVGKEKIRFGLIKFATMKKNSPFIGSGEITLKNDPRVLPFGKILRKTKFNEIPQLINILLGQMSIVGPRPMVPNTFSDYPIQAQEKLSTVRPGLTGIGSIFFRDEESYLDDNESSKYFYKNIIIPYKSELEQWYIENYGIKIYLLIIFITAWVLIFPTSSILRKFLHGLPEIPLELSDKYKT